LLIARQVISIWPLEKAACVGGFAVRTVILKGKHSVARRSGPRSRIAAYVTTVRALSSIPLSSSFQANRESTRLAESQGIEVRYLVQLPTVTAHKNVIGMSLIFSQHVSRKKFKGSATLRAVMELDPKEGFHVRIRGSAPEASRLVERANLGLQNLKQVLSGFSIVVKVNGLKLLAGYPISHRIDIEANDVASQTVGLDQGRPAPHEWVHDAEALEVMWSVVNFPERPFTKLG